MRWACNHVLSGSTFNRKKTLADLQLMEQVYPGLLAMYMF